MFGNWKRTAAALIAAALMTGTLSAFAVGPNPAEEAEEPVGTATLAAAESTEAPAIRLEEIHTADGGVVVDVIIDNTPYLVTADVEIGLQNAELGAVTSMPGGHVVCERDGEGYLLRWRRTNGDNAAESTTIIATVGIANSNGDTLITATCKDCRVTDAAIATEMAPSELHLTAAPAFEVTGMGTRTHHRYMIALNNIPADRTDNIVVIVEFSDTDFSELEEVRVDNDNLGSTHFGDNSEVVITINDLPHHMGTVTPIILDIDTKEEAEMDVHVSVTGTITYNDGSSTTEMAPSEFVLFCGAMRIELQENQAGRLDVCLHNFSGEASIMLCAYRPNGKFIGTQVTEVSSVEGPRTTTASFTLSGEELVGGVNLKVIALDPTTLAPLCAAAWVPGAGPNA